jgi:hypothetical protein
VQGLRRWWHLQLMLQLRAQTSAHEVQGLLANDLS